MTVLGIAPLPRVAAMAGVALLAVTVPAVAQTTSEKKPAPHQQKTAKSAPKPTDPKSDYWSVNYSIPDQYKPRPERARSSGDGGVQTEITGELGRVPVQSTSGRGSFGLTSQSVNRAEFSDGRAVPGLDPNTQKPSSFVGLSLSVQSNNNSFPIPLPVYGRPE